MLTGLALHQALTASEPAAPAQVRRLAARNVRFVSENAELLSRFRTQRPTYVAAEPPPPETPGRYDPFADTVLYDSGAAAPLPIDSLGPDTLLPDTLPVPIDTMPPPVLPPVPPPAPVVPPRGGSPPSPPSATFPMSSPPPSAGSAQR